nr:PAS domain S-box protein [uncultured Flavobacterium sp.]
MKKKWAKFVDWFIIRPRTVGFVVFILLFLTTVYVSDIRQNILLESEENKMNVILKDIHQNIEKSLRETYMSSFELALTINDKGIPENFEAVSKEILDNYPLINTVQLAPNGIIKYIYPLKGNEKALHLNLLKSASLNGQDFKSNKKSKIHFDGPFNLKQGGVGIIIRLPIYKKREFWGFTSLIVKFESLLKVAKVDAIDTNKYLFQFTRKNPVTHKDVFFRPNKINLSKDHYVTYSMPNSEWKLYLISKEPYGIYPLTFLSLIIGTVFSILFGILTTRLLKKPEELQLLVNDQLDTLLKNELQFQTIFEQATVGFIIVDAISGNHIKVNAKYCEILGYSEEDFKDKDFTFSTHPDDKETITKQFKNLNSGKIKEHITEKRYITKSGKTIWVNLSISPLWKKNQKPTSNIIFIKDITLKKEALALIEKSEKRFKTLFENSTLPLWEEDFSGIKKHLEELNLTNQDPEIVYSYLNENPDEVLKCISFLKIIDVNCECLKLHKAKSKKSLIKNLPDLIDISAFDDVKKQLVAISQGDQTFNIDSRIKTMDGEYRDINLRWNVIHGYEDSLERIILSTEDITERKATEKYILDSQEKTESIINSIEGIVWEYNLDSEKVTFVSEKVESILGYTVEEWKTIPNFWADHIHHEDKNWVLATSHAADIKKENRVLEYRMLSKSGKIIWIRDIVNFVFKNNQGVDLRGMMIDITSMKIAEEDLKNSFELVTEQNKRLLNFSYIISHNLRSHTSNIESIVSLLEFADTEEEQGEMMQLLKTVTTSLSETMDHLNEVININTNINLVTKPLNLNKYIDNAKNVISEQILLSETTIIKNIPDDLTINYNPAYMESILYNLISNAIRYRHPERKPIITINWSNENNVEVLEVSDNGIGIDLKKNRDKIFGLYKTFNNNPDSRGIGLFITRNQVEAMGGEINVESQLNEGTTFKIYLK